MRVLNSQGNTADTAKKMAQMMFDIENGFQNIEAGEDKNDNFMKFSVSTIIKDTPTIEYHYKPATGVVFYIPGEQFDLDQLIKAVCSEIDKLDYGHLIRYRVVDATPCAVIYDKPQLLKQTFITNYNQDNESDDYLRVLPARRLVKLNNNPMSHLPPIISTTASFTWYFLNIAALLKYAKIRIPIGPETFNAITASVLYDDAKLINLPTNYKIGTIQKLNTHFSYLKTPPKYQKVVRLLKKESSLSLFFHPEHGIVVVSRSAAYGLHKKQRLCLIDHEVHYSPWEVLIKNKKIINCDMCIWCKLPLWGVSYVLEDMKWEDDDILAIKENARIGRTDECGIKRIPSLGEGVVVCQWCYTSLPSCVWNHLDPKVTRTEIKSTKVEVYSKIKKYKSLIPLLEMENIVSLNKDGLGALILANSLILVPKMSYLYPSDTLYHVTLLQKRLPVLTLEEIFEYT